ncbi:MAG: carbohydrate ABC transporter permease [Candidatus Heimdallarchaeota archaeon]
MKDETKTAIICVAPAIAIIGAFTLFPLFYSFYLSLTDWDGFSRTVNFVGFSNYSKLIFSEVFWNSIKVTLYYAVGVTILSVISGLALASVINRSGRLMSFYRVIFFIPVITSFVAAGVVWKSLFSPAGFLSGTFRSIGLSPPNWLADPTWAMPALILVGVWSRLGFNTVISLAGLQAIPKGYYDKAKIDGAGAWHRFRFITVPLMKPIILLLLVMAMVDAFLIFDLAFIMTGGGPLGATNVIGLYLYKNAFRYYKMGYASTVAVMVFLIILVISLTQMKLLKFGRGA